MPASINQLTEVVALGQPPWLIGINRGGSVTLPASVKTLAVAVAGSVPGHRITEAGNRPNHLEAKRQMSCKSFCIVVKQRVL